MSIRMPAELEKELKYFAREEKLDQTSDAARKLISLGMENWRKEKALRLFSEGKISFTKAAHMTQISVWEWAELIRERKIVWIKNRDMILEDIRKAKE